MSIRLKRSYAWAYLRASAVSAFANQVDIEITHSLLSLVPLSVAFYRKPREEQAYWREATIQVCEALRERLVQVLSDFLALQRTRRGENDKLGQHFGGVEAPPIAGAVHLKDAKPSILVEEVGYFLLNHADVGTEVIKG